jgi:histidinol dehydrogenase
VLITPSMHLAKSVGEQVLERTKGNVIARRSLSRRGAVLLVESLEGAVTLANRIAPEHLTLPKELLPLVEHAGSIFLDEFTPQSAGDYISGPSHVLPTGGMARVRGGLSVLDFVRTVSVQQISQEGMHHIGPAAIALARTEGLLGHAESLRARLVHA